MTSTRSRHNESCRDSAGTQPGVPMIDLHCHILPALDDGARDLADSLAMAGQAACATPHIRHDHDVAIGQLAERIAELQAAIDAAGLDVQILAGGEVAETEADRLTDAELQTVSLGGAGAWVLLEPASGPLGDSLERRVARLHERGVRCVIAHPERHAGPDFAERVRRLADAGCLIQWTAEFIANEQPGDYVLNLAAEGLVHLLASDAHSARIGRPVALTAGFEALGRVWSPERVAWSAEVAPQAIVGGETEIAPPPA